MKPLLVLRPEPGASKTANKARALGLEPIAVPLFNVRPLAWAPEPAETYDGLFITSHNALKCRIENFTSFRKLPIFCVGDATAEIARRVGFANIIAGKSDASALADLAASHGHKRLLWLAGLPSGGLEHPDLTFDVKHVYETPVRDLEAADIAQLNQPSIALLHSPRAAHRFAALVPDKARTVVVAISEKAAISAGPGWSDVHWPSTPTDDAMLALAAPLCHADETGTSV